MTNSPSGATGRADVAVNKDALRALLRSQRRLRSQEKMTDVAVALGRAWPTLRSMSQDPTLVLGFQPTRFEPDPRVLLGSALSEGKRVLLPRPVGTERLEWVSAETSHLGTRLDELPSPHGPAVGVGGEIAAGHSALILIPALAADPKTGFRLGQGGGYYDRFLADVRRTDGQVLLVTIVHDNELLDVPAMPHDQAIDAILTESGLRVIERI